MVTFETWLKGNTLHVPERRNRGPHDDEEEEEIDEEEPRLSKQEEEETSKEEGEWEGKEEDNSRVRPLKSIAGRYISPLSYLLFSLLSPSAVSSPAHLTLPPLSYLSLTIQTAVLVAKKLSSTPNTYANTLMDLPSDVAANVISSTPPTCVECLFATRRIQMESM